VATRPPQPPGKRKFFASFFKKEALSSTLASRGPLHHGAAQLRKRAETTFLAAHQGMDLCA
jgi:hypothetical protein